MLTYIDGKPVKAGLLLRGPTVFWKKMINTNMEAATFFDISAVRKAKHLKKNNLYQVNKYQ